MWSCRHCFTFSSKFATRLVSIYCDENLRLTLWRDVSLSLSHFLVISLPLQTTCFTRLFMPVLVAFVCCVRAACVCARACVCVCVALVYDRWRLTSLWKKFDFSTPTSMSTGMRRLHHNRNCRRRLTLVAYCEIALSTGLLKIILFLRICFFVYQTSSRFNSLFFVLLENDKNKKELKGNLNILWHLWQ